MRFEDLYEKQYAFWKMDERFYSTGQVARTLGVTQARIRSLCESGAIEAEMTPGGQWRIPTRELDRLKCDGLPAVPRHLPVAETARIDRAPSGDRNTRSRLTDEPSKAVISAAEQVTITEDLLRKRKLEQELEEVEDWFRERERKASQRRSEAERVEQAKYAQEQAERQRQSWLCGWEKYALRLLPVIAFDVPPEVRLAVHEAVRNRLRNLEPIPSRDVTKRLVDSEIEKTLKPWRDRKEMQRAVEHAIESLPWHIRFKPEWASYKARALQAATAAVNSLRTADRRTREAMALSAVQPIEQEFRHLTDCVAVVTDMDRRYLGGATPDERRAAAEAGAAVLVKLPHGTTKSALEEACGEVIAPFRQGAVNRQSEEQEERRRKEEERQKSRKVSLAQSWADVRLARVSEYLAELEAKRKLEFDGFFDQWNLSEQIKAKIRPALVQELLNAQDISDRES